MSSESEVRIFTIENPRFPGEGSSSQGKSGPKLRPRGVSDGQRVEIRAPPIAVLRDVGTQKDNQSQPLEVLVQTQCLYCRKIRSTMGRRDGEGNTSTEADESTLTRKATI